MAKGLSQILWLIISASVLMMAALTMIFLVQGGLGDIGDTSGAQACLSTIDTKCSVGGSNIEVPSSCVVENADGSEELIPEVQSQYPDAAPNGQISCN